MTIIKDLFGKQYTIVPCTIEDIPVHFSLVEEFIPSEEVVQYKKRMADCIIAGSAYTLTDGSCFLYYHNYKPCCADGVSFYGKGSPLKMLALFAGIFTEIDHHTFKIDFRLHKGQIKTSCRSIITKESLKRQSIKNYPLVIRVDKIRAKVEHLYNKRGVKWEV